MTRPCNARVHTFRDTHLLLASKGGQDTKASERYATRSAHLPGRLSTRVSAAVKNDSVNSEERIRVAVRVSEHFVLCCAQLQVII
jgi:hypothetical protein